KGGEHEITIAVHIANNTPPRSRRASHAFASDIHVARRRRDCLLAARLLLRYRRRMRWFCGGVCSVSTGWVTNGWVTNGGGARLLGLRPRWGRGPEVHDALWRRAPGHLAAQPGRGKLHRSAESSEGHHHDKRTGRSRTAGRVGRGRGGEHR